MPIRRTQRKRQRLGMALVEVSVSLVIFAVASGMMLQTMHAGYGLRGQAHEEWLASAAAQTVLESMRGMPFDQVSLSYDEDQFNDPGGPGTSHGAAFDIPGLDPTPGDPDGRVGEIILPVINTGTEVAERFEVREDMVEPRLGLPRDLTGDAIIDDLDHRDDVAILPILVRVRWTGRNGPRVLNFFTALTETTP